jgi:hypothetical protein
MGMEKFSMKTGRVPSRPGKTKSKRDQSSFRLFCSGDPFKGGKLDLSNYKPQSIKESTKGAVILSTCRFVKPQNLTKVKAGNTKLGRISAQLTCLTGLDQSALQIKTKIVSCHTADSKPVKQKVNCTVILPPLVFPGKGHWLGERKEGS